MDRSDDRRIINVSPLDARNREYFVSCLHLLHMINKCEQIQQYMFVVYIKLKPKDLRPSTLCVTISETGWILVSRLTLTQLLKDAHFW